jgi:TonB family protein
MEAQGTLASGSVWLKRVALILLALLVLAGMVYLGKALMSGGTPHKKSVTTVKLLPDTPPPPPPPKEPPKEQPKEIKEVKEIQQPKPDPSPPAEVLKMEGAAGDGPSPFAAGAVNNEYKGGDVGTRIGGGASKYQFAYYTGMIKSHIEQALAKDKTLASGAYKVVVKVWVASNGRIQRFEIAGSSGDPTIDALIKKAVDEMPALAESPPSDMPQPVKMRVTARSVG